MTKMSTEDDMNQAFSFLLSPIHTPLSMASLNVLQLSGSITSHISNYTPVQLHTKARGLMSRAFTLKSAIMNASRKTDEPKKKKQTTARSVVLAYKMSE